MKRIGLFSLFLLSFIFIGCADKLQIDNKAPGFLIINEGSFGNTMGSVSSVFAQKDSFLIEQRGGDLGVTTCYATRHNGKYYFVSKQGDRFIECSDASLSNRRTLTDIGAADGRAFVGIDGTRGAISTSKGVFLMTLSPELVVGNVITQTKGSQCGGMYYLDGRLYVINQSKGLQVFDTNKDYALVSELADVHVGFTRSRNGELWCAGKDFLVKITNNRPTILGLPSIVTIYNSWGAWNAGSLCSSTIDNALYFAKHSSAWGGGNEIYKYDIDKNSCTVFAKSKDATDSFYGASIGVHPNTGNIWATFVGGYDYNDNRIVEFDTTTGDEINRYTYGGYKFPVLILF